MDFEAKIAARPEDERPVGIAHGQDFLTGSIGRPSSPHAVAVIANDHGCARHVSALLTLSRELRQEGLATLLLDVARPGEDRASEDVLAARIDSGRAWLTKTDLRSLPLVLIGMGDAAPAALLSAAARPSGVTAVVACGRDPAAAGIALGRMSAPTLLVARWRSRRSGASGSWWCSTTSPMARSTRSTWRVPSWRSFPARAAAPRLDQLVTAVLAADSDRKPGPPLPPAGNSDSHQLADAIAIERREGIWTGSVNRLSSMKRSSLLG